MTFIKVTGDMPKKTLKISKPVWYFITIVITIAVAFAAIKLYGIYEKHMWEQHTRRAG